MSYAAQEYMIDLTGLFSKVDQPTPLLKRSVIAEEMIMKSVIQKIVEVSDRGYQGQTGEKDSIIKFRIQTKTSMSIRVRLMLKSIGSKKLLLWTRQKEDIEKVKQCTGAHNLGKVCQKHEISGKIV